MDAGFTSLKQPAHRAVQRDLNDEALHLLDPALPEVTTGCRACAEVGHGARARGNFGTAPAGPRRKRRPQ